MLGTLPDAKRRAVRDPRLGMELQIVIEEFDPPSGRGVVDGRDAWTFAGWLELIEKVERLKDTYGIVGPGEDLDRPP